jgi:hypothetical protein
MSTDRPLEVRRQTNDRLAGGKVSCAVVFDHEFTTEDMRRFYCLPAEGDPNPIEFSFDGRVIRYVCPEEDEPKWRLALEIFIVKTFRQTSGAAKPAGKDRDTRSKLGLHKLYLG